MRMTMRSRVEVQVDRIAWRIDGSSAGFEVVAYSKLPLSSVRYETFDQVYCTVSCKMESADSGFVRFWMCTHRRPALSPATATSEKCSVFSRM